MTNAKINSVAAVVLVIVAVVGLVRDSVLAAAYPAILAVLVPFSTYLEDRYPIGPKLWTRRRVIDTTAVALVYVAFAVASFLLILGEHVYWTLPAAALTVVIATLVRLVTDGLRRRRAAGHRAAE